MEGLLARVFRSAGLKPPRPNGRVGPRIHDLRHTFVVHRMTEWYRAGINPEPISSCDDANLPKSHDSVCARWFQIPLRCLASCPNEDAIDEYALGRLQKEESLSLERHLAGCNRWHRMRNSRRRSCWHFGGLQVDPIGATLLRLPQAKKSFSPTIAENWQSETGRIGSVTSVVIACKSSPDGRPQSSRDF